MKIDSFISSFISYFLLCIWYLNIWYILVCLSVAGITGDVNIDANGDRIADYSLLDMDPDNGEFKVCKQVNLLVVKTYIWRNSYYDTYLLLHSLTILKVFSWKLFYYDCYICYVVRWGCNRAYYNPNMGEWWMWDALLKLCYWLVQRGSILLTLSIFL